MKFSAWQTSHKAPDIVEWPDGKVENVPVENVRFLAAFAAA
jgi:hypothetical protein